MYLNRYYYPTSSYVNITILFYFIYFIRINYSMHYSMIN